MLLRRMVPDGEWAQGRVASLPTRWQRRILGRWQRQHPRDHVAANTEIRRTTDTLLSVRIPLDASDATICEAAKALAERCASLAEIGWLYPDAQRLRAGMERTVRAQGIEPPPEKCKDGPAIARMCCELWWRRKLRRQQARVVEAAAIRLGYVNRTRDLYVSNERLRARQQQHARNAAMLQDTIARNELGQEYTLAELAAKGPSNKAIRRAELMTRISGFERIARELGHAGLFLTLTCPSRFHRWRTVNGGAAVIPNPNYDERETPATGQAYLARTWARIRAALARQGVTLYGFRIAEPQHDGTPHWHFLVFHPQDRAQLVRDTITNKALQDTPDEPGAREHRCDFKAIDWSKGSAAGYIAKYVAKNIDGYRVDKDLFGNDAMESSARVEAWAATWGIRQFQQVGGPPVGVWRELRRVAAIPAQAPDYLHDAHRAANKTTDVETGEVKSVSWAAYTRAQGGVFCGRRARIKVATVQPETLGRYGDEATPRPVGVETVSREFYTPEHMAHMGGRASRLVTWVIESSRHVWEIVRRALTGAAHGVVSIAERAKPAQPWTCVNNCTEGVSNGQECNESQGSGGASRVPQPVSDGADDGGERLYPADGGGAGHRGGDSGRRPAVVVGA